MWAIIFLLNWAMATTVEPWQNVKRKERASIKKRKRSRRKIKKRRERKKRPSLQHSQLPLSIEQKSRKIIKKYSRHFESTRAISCRLFNVDIFQKVFLAWNDTVHRWKRWHRLHWSPHRWRPIQWSISRNALNLEFYSNEIFTVDIRRSLSLSIR